MFQGLNEIMLVFFPPIFIFTALKLKDKKYQQTNKQIRENTQQQQQQQTMHTKNKHSGIMGTHETYRQKTRL